MEKENGMKVECRDARAAAFPDRAVAPQSHWFDGRTIALEWIGVAERKQGGGFRSIIISVLKRFPFNVHVQDYHYSC